MKPITLKSPPSGNRNRGNPSEECEHTHHRSDAGHESQGFLGIEVAGSFLFRFLFLLGFLSLRSRFDLRGFEFLLTYLFHEFGSRRQDALCTPGPFCGFDPSEFIEQRRHLNRLRMVRRRHVGPRSPRASEAVASPEPA